jgi:hypothetical protein
MALPNPLPPSFDEFVSAYFLGPRAENVEILKGIFDEALKQHAELWGHIAGDGTLANMESMWWVYPDIYIDCELMLVTRVKF